MSSSFHQPSGVIAPKRVVVVGAGMLGLATAWFLQEYGVEVTVLERADVAAGSSWGNAGWLSPGMAIPLPDPTVMRYALRSLFNRDAALSVPLTRDPAVWRFLMNFARRSTNAQWRRAMQGYLSINRDALGAFDELSDGGVTSATISAPIMACFKEGAQAHELRHELERIEAVGQHVDVHELTGDEARALVDQIAEVVQVVVQINGQRYLDPGAYVQSLAASVMARGGELRTGFRVRTLRRGAGAITLEGEAGSPNGRTRLSSRPGRGSTNWRGRSVYACASRPGGAIRSVSTPRSR